MDWVVSVDYVMGTVSRSTGDFIISSEINKFVDSDHRR